MKNLFASSLALLAITVFAAPPTPPPVALEVKAFLDYQCPYSNRHMKTLASLKAEFGSQIHVTLVNYPLDFHPQARHLAKAEICGRDFAQRDAWVKSLFAIGTQEGSKIPELVLAAATEAGENRDALENCIGLESTESTLAAEIAHADELEVNSTPTTFVGTKKVAGAQPFEDVRKVVADELKNR